MSTETGSGSQGLNYWEVGVSDNPDLGQAEPSERVEWYRRCLEDLQDGRVVRGLAEAKAGYDSAMDELRALAARLAQAEQALEAYDWLLKWCEREAPAGLEEMPTGLWRATKALAAPDPGEADA